MTETVIEARRTILRPGRELDYERVHARIPAAVASALRECGVVTWHIWRDGSVLFHAIETLDGYDRMVAEISRLKPIDDEWDAQIDSLLDSEPASDTMLRLVWSLDDNE